MHASQSLWGEGTRRTLCGTEKALLEFLHTSPAPTLLRHWSNAWVLSDTVTCSTIWDRQHLNDLSTTHSRPTAISMFGYLSAGFRGVPRVCRRRTAVLSAADCRVLVVADRRLCSPRTATFRRPRKRSSARPTEATAERVRKTTGLDLHQVREKKQATVGWWRKKDTRRSVFILERSFFYLVCSITHTYIT